MNSDMPASQRWPITISIMLATLMAALDMTIANVALPHIQGSLSASQEQIAWVLTSYIVAAAIMIPATGWLVGRMGRKNLFLISIVGFTATSVLCGVAGDLTQIVIFRLLQGAFGAPLMPLSQSVLLDINPREKHAQAMGIWGAGSLLGPILGPALGGWLTDHWTWRWVFLINVPVGLLAAAGVFLFFPREAPGPRKRFDFLGFGSLVLFIAGLQLVLDRGSTLDWFQSPEIWIETILAMIGLWVFVTHTLTSAQPLFDRRLAGDRNFVTGASIGFFFGTLLQSTMTLLPTLMQALLGYSVLLAGVVSMPRGVGTLAGMMLVGWLPARLDPRVTLLAGLAISIVALTQMMSFDLAMGSMPFVTSGLLQGLGLGMMYVPLTTSTFATLAPSLRAEGSALFGLVRNLGSSAGISFLQYKLVSNTAAMHASLAAHIDPASPVVQGAGGGRWDLTSLAGLETLNNEIGRQATMVGYVDSFKILLLISIACMPLLMLVRPGKRGGEAVHVAVE